jgi:hypothetical protein
MALSMERFLCSEWLMREPWREGDIARSRRALSPAISGLRHCEDEAISLRKGTRKTTEIASLRSQ